MKTTPLAEFGKIDQTGDPAYFVRFLDEACSRASFKAYKQHLLASMNLQTGGSALDVGCGTGDDLREMARSVEPGGRLVGVDNSVAMIDEANRRGTGTNVEFHVAEGTALPFADGTFDASRADRSLMHVPDARRVLAEMVRVTRAGGRVVVYEVDFETVVIDCEDRALTRKVIHTWCDGFRDGWLGRRMPGLFREAGLKQLSVAPFVLELTPGLALPILGAATVERAVKGGAVTPGEGERWLMHLEELQKTGKFFATLTGFLVAGTK